MELRELAERIVFGTTLEEKLQRPETITDEYPGPSIVAPEAPGRPAELRFKPLESGKADFPGIQRLEDERERGRLLHFFANHELLATELMALVLLRFPDAPAAFRRGVLQTLKDEQNHTRLYMRRMRECGVEFGELPVSGYFWRAVSGMEHPMDYVAGLSLTFEQANLDFCRQFARGFETVGDAETARLLDGIYRDEIAHVAYGLKWFRRWKNPEESDWQAFCQRLRFPLSPSRAKGVIFNSEGRRAAGFDADFIDELKVHSQSKGRTPHVYIFNPFEEERIAEGPQYTPVKRQAALARDLANIPQFLCRRDDVVLVDHRPSASFLSVLHQAGFPLPEFVELKDGKIDADGSLAQRKLAGLRPWGWGPASLELFEPILANIGSEERAPGQVYNERIVELYSKAWSTAFLRRIHTDAPMEGWLCTESDIGVTAWSLEEALAAVAVIRQRGHHKVVVKQALGLAGRNAIRLWEPEILEIQRQWMISALARGRTVVVEPWLERELDFSIQLEMSPAGLRVCGYTGLINDRKGQFLANWAAPNYTRRMPPSIAALLREPRDVAVRLQRLYAHIFVSLEKELRNLNYLGPLGIDAFVYRTEHRVCRLKPIVEINPRYTMGRLTVELMKRAAPGSHGLFRLVGRPALRDAGFADFAAYSHSLTGRFPLQLAGEPDPKIQAGAICLNDPAEAQTCLAVFQVGGPLDALRGELQARLITIKR